MQHLQAGRHGEVGRGELHPALGQWGRGGHTHPVDLQPGLGLHEVLPAQVCSGHTESINNQQKGLRNIDLLSGSD